VTVRGLAVLVVHCYCGGKQFLVFIVSVTALAVLQGATLDYNERINPSRFRVIQNPAGIIQP